MYRVSLLFKWHIEKGAFKKCTPASSSSSSSSSCFNPLHPFTPQSFSPLYSSLSRHTGEIFFSILFQENKNGFHRLGRQFIQRKTADSAERQRILQKRCTHEPARTGLPANCHNKAHKFASESGTFYFFVLPCSQCRSGEIIGRREQLQRGDREREKGERKELAAHDHRLSSHPSTGAFIIALATTYGNTTRRDCGHTCFWRTQEDPCGKRAAKSEALVIEKSREKAKHHPVGEPWLMCADCQYAFHHPIWHKKNPSSISVLLRVRVQQVFFTNRYLSCSCDTVQEIG